MYHVDFKNLEPIKKNWTHPIYDILIQRGEIMNIILERETNTPLYRQIMNQLIYQIDEGILYENFRLPSERELANQLGVNRSTVVRAYDELNAEGFVEKRASSGTYVIGQSEAQAVNHLRERIQFNYQKYQQNDYMTKVEEMIKMDASSVLDAYSGELPYNLIPNISLPNVNWQSFLSVEVSRLGYKPLRKNIATLVGKMYSYEPKIEEIMLTAGGQQSLVLLIQSLLKPGDTVALEDPSFFNGISVLNAMSIKVVRIPIDKDGLCLNELEDAIKKESIQLILTNPNFQNPTGTTMSLTRRKKLIALCELYRIPIIEDDVFGQLAYEAPSRIPLLKELSPQLVIYIGSLSKILGSRMQLGWIEAPVYVLDEVAKLRDEYETQLNIFPQVMASYAVSDPEFSEKLMVLRQTLEERMRYFIEAIKKELSSSLDYTMPKGGYYIWLTYTKRTLIKEDWRLLIKDSIAVLPGFVMSKEMQSCRVNVSRLTTKQIDLFIIKFKDIITQWNKHIEE